MLICPLLLKNIYQLWISNLCQVGVCVLGHGFRTVVRIQGICMGQKEQLKKHLQFMGDMPSHHLTPWILHFVSVQMSATIHVCQMSEVWYKCIRNLRYLVLLLWNICRCAEMRMCGNVWRLLVLSLSLSRSLFLTYSVFLTKKLCDLTSVLEIFWLSMLLSLRHWSAFLSWEPTPSLSRSLFLTHSVFLTNILCDDVGVRNILAKHGTVATSLQFIFMMGIYRFTVVLRGESLQNVNTQYLPWQSWTRTQLFSQHKLHTGACHVQNDLFHLPHLTTAARGGSCVRSCKRKSTTSCFSRFSGTIACTDPFAAV